MKKPYNISGCCYFLGNRVIARQPQLLQDMAESELVIHAFDIG